MNKYFLSAIIFFNFINSALAYSNADQQINLLFPSVSSVVTAGGNLNTNINPETGEISSNLTPAFYISTNNNKGIIAEFSANIDTTSGMYNAMAGSNSNSKNGTILLSNYYFKPTTNAVENALSDSASPINNPNVMGYSITFEKLNNKAQDVVFDSKNSPTASGLVLNKKGNTTVLITISNNSVINSKTYDMTTDYAGMYQSVIYCTVYEP